MIPGEDPHARVGQVEPHQQRVLRPQPKPVGHCPRHGRFERRLCRGGGGEPRTCVHGKDSAGSVRNPAALSVCCGVSSSGLPIGMQIVGRPFDEETVLGVGHAYERAAGWYERTPELL